MLNLNPLNVSISSFSAAVAATFEPTDIDGIVFWLKADDGPDDPVDGQPVTTWSDKSGNGEDFTQSTTSSKPRYDTGQQGGLPSLYFDGGDFLIHGDKLSESTQGDIFIVGSRGNNYNIQFHAATSDDATTEQYLGFNISVGNAASPTFAVETIAYYSPFDVAQGGTLTAETPSLIEWNSTGSAFGISINGSAQTITTRSGTDSGKWWGDMPGRDNWTIGALMRTSAASFLTAAYISEVIVYDTKLTTSQRTDIETYLNDKYSIY